MGKQPQLPGSRAKDVMCKRWDTPENTMGGQASYYEEFKAIGAFLLPRAATGVSLLAGWCLIGATPRGQPWTSAVPLTPGCHGLGARRMAVLSTFCALSLGRHGHAN